MARSTLDFVPGKVNILLVDDQPANLLALEAVLADLGQNLVKATSGEQALRYLLNDDFAVILLDIQMQGLDGFETARLIRGRDRSRHTPIVFLTAFESPAFPAARAYSLGAVDYLIKPVVPEILRAKVNGFVELYRKTEQIRWQAEQLRLMERRESEARQNAILETALDAIITIDQDGTILDFNPAAERTFGYARAAALGRNITQLLVPSALRDQAIQGLAHYRATGQGAFLNRRIELPALRADGTEIPVELAITRVSSSGPPIFTGFVRDISAAKQAEAERAQLLEELQERAHKLAEASEHKDRFLSMMAHELRNPLAPILNGLHLARLPNLSAAARTEALDMIGRHIRHLARLVDDLLEASRIMHGRIRLRRERLDLAQLVRTVVQDHRETLERAKLRLTAQTPETPVWVQADPTRLTQVLSNLLDNAAKFTDSGGRVEVRLTVDAQARQALLTVRDTGIGIEPELLPRLFDVFVQGDRSLDRARGGLGLGLALVKELVALHGGEVRALSAGPGHGTEVQVRLPVQDEPAALADLPDEPRPAQARLRVVVIEDNRDAAESLRMLLEMLGHDVLVAHTGPEGLRKVRAHRPDVVLSDIGLPGGMDGYAVAAALRRDPATAGARLVAISGYGSEDDLRRSREAGFDYHLVKPADPEQLERLLATLRCPGAEPGDPGG